MAQSKLKLLKNVKIGGSQIGLLRRQKGKGSLKLACEIGLAIVHNLNEKSNNLDHTHPDLHYIFPTKKPANESVF